ncbi:hypothetical protein GQF61_10250 [Sphingobacterium sp. DK4209]|uniref:Uncharacterized protein n=1 Tax=Sphingobacterium zhuxiongii TaxID=2662364 RepID=A0A5Q0Q671_9SPHI|nr:hypothetical protein [Sphingobacterium sp. DK4209]QGA24963.1 hypothetical protein GFH32_00885 [Sphingobacterium sp. dk4302]
MKTLQVSNLSLKQLNIQRRNSYGFVLASLLITTLMILFAIVFLHKQQEMLLPVLVAASLLITGPAILKLRQINLEIRAKLQSAS